MDDGGVKVVKEPNHSRFQIKDCLHLDTEEIKIQLKNLSGTAEALSRLIVLVFPDPPAPAFTTESSFSTEFTMLYPIGPDELKDGGTIILGYHLEKRKKGTNQWVALNSAINEPIEALKYSMKNVSEGSEYEFRVSAINASGAGEPSHPSLMVCAKTPNMKPYFKDRADFMAVRAGNTVRIVVNYEMNPRNQAQGCLSSRSMVK
ncbi:hypothetical protein PGIGA_G00107980 [Pangasianodon gigas]|uniref:Uncharacterized protein n=1 Tax=Pangasianodon gigas TaxID=30993 RepID=A0ACC5W8D0_PANGG|nr:hypothetical protein [Pangasianodon gigas]